MACSTTMSKDARNQIQKEVLDRARHVVIKVGSAVLTDDSGLDRDMISHLSSQMARLQASGRKVILVSSGAVAAGMAKMEGRIQPRTIPEKQAMAAIGQAHLMQAYEEAFEEHGFKVAQVLLTRAGLIPRNRYVNAKNTLKTLIDWNIIPIINENDTVATEELQFTDNDALSVLVVNLTEADVLITLSDIDGLYDADPRDNPNARKISQVEKIDRRLLALAGSAPGRAGRGGMKSKLEAARMVTACGIPMIIAAGRTREVISRLFEGEPLGTFFHASRRRIYGRKPWIAYALERKGTIEIDDGAVKALKQGGGSLLPVGIKRVSGDFHKGDCILCIDERGEEVAIGLTNFDSAEIRKICGKKSDRIQGIIGRKEKEEVIHRDDMVTLL